MADGNDRDDDDYKVGYGKPPKHSQFPPGKSGNPKGRTKGARGLKTDLEAELKSKHTAYIDKKPVKGTKQRLTIKMLATRAAHGDLKAAQLLVPLIVQVLGVDDRGGERRPLSTIDRAILDDLLRNSDGLDPADDDPPALPGPANDSTPENDDA